MGHERWWGQAPVSPFPGFHNGQGSNKVPFKAVFYELLNEPKDPTGH